MKRRVFLAVLSFITVLWAPYVLHAMTADDAFDPNIDKEGSYEVNVTSIVVQPDKKILIIGHFTTVGGVARNNIARLNPDGSLDETFNPENPLGDSGEITSIALQPDGKILVDGHAWLGDDDGPTTMIFRLNPDGSLYESFNVNVEKCNVCSASSMALQPDGKILIGGFFTALGGVPRNSLARLNPDGTLDEDFDPNVDGVSIETILLQPDGKILIGGEFSTVGGVARENIARLHPNGSLDGDFDPQPLMIRWVRSIALQTDEKILVGGKFFPALGEIAMVRLNSNGSLDDTFNPDVGVWDEENGFGLIDCFGVQSDGKILIGGHFDTVGDTDRRFLARLNPNGSLDDPFDPQISCIGYCLGSSVTAIALQSDDGRTGVMPTLLLTGGMNLNYSLPAGRRLDLCVIDVAGRTVLARSDIAPCDRLILDLGRRPRGVYFIRLQTGNATVERKVLLAK